MDRYCRPNQIVNEQNKQFQIILAGFLQVKQCLCFLFQWLSHTFPLAALPGSLPTVHSQPYIYLHVQDITQATNTTRES